jgi:hypothetical protein
MKVVTVRSRSTIRSRKKDACAKIVKNIGLVTPSLPLPEGQQDNPGRRKSGAPEPWAGETNGLSRRFPSPNEFALRLSAKLA